MPRNRKLEGIQQRTDAAGVTGYRGYMHANGRKRFGSWTVNLDEARAWRRERMQEAEDGLLTGERLNLGEAAETWVEGIANGTILNRSGRQYKPSVVRAYRRDIEIVATAIGRRKPLDEVRVPHAQLAADRLRQDLSLSRVRHVMFTLRAMYGWAIPRGYATINPGEHMRLPAPEEKRRERIAPVDETTKLVLALQVPDRTAFALACYAGLRAGELLALCWEDIDLDARTIQVRRAVDTTEGMLIDPKSYAGKRSIPIVDRLLAILLDHQAELGDAGALFPAQPPRHGRKLTPHQVEDIRASSDSAVQLALRYRVSDALIGKVRRGELYVGQQRTTSRRPDAVMSLGALHRRLVKKWTAARLRPLGLHEARHTFASMLIAAGVNAKALQSYMGHSSITITFDRYGHLFPGHEAETLQLLNQLLEDA